MKSAYLLINFLTILFPVLLSFDKRVQFYKQWKFIFPALLISGLVFLVWDYVFTISNVWSFNEEYVTGVYFLELPIEEILFFITVPFACIFIYECLNYYVKRDVLKRFTTIISTIILFFSVVMLVFFHDRVYTLVTFSLLGFLVLYAGFFRKKFWLGRFYLAYFVSMIPFFIVNGILTSIPIVMYNNAENADLRIGSIPLEDSFYSMAMLLMNVLFFESLRKKENSKAV